MRRSFSNLTLKEAMELVPAENITPWALQTPERLPSDILLAVLDRLQSFDLTGSEPAKILLIDILLSEIVPLHPELKVWKGESLETAPIGGIADYLLAPRRAYIDTPSCVRLRRNATTLRRERFSVLLRWQSASRITHAMVTKPPSTELSPMGKGGFSIA